MPEENENTNRRIGYARVSTASQELNLQLDALKLAGIPDNLIFIDKVSGAKTERPGLTACMNELQAGDTLIIWRLDRLGRSLKHLIEIVEELKGRGVGFRSINDGGIDTTTASGEMVFNIFATLAQFERRLIQERTQAGLKAARARGKNGGRPKNPGKRPTGSDGQEDEQEPEHQRRGDMQYAEDFEGVVLSVSEDRSVTPNLKIA